MRSFRLTDIDDSRTTLILFNGGGQPPFNKFDRLVKFLSNYDLNLISVELPGHGKSPFSHKVSVEEMLEGFCHEFARISKPYSSIGLLGFSLGGLLALKALENMDREFEFVIAIGAGIVISEPEEKQMKQYTTREFFEKRHWLPLMLEYHEEGWRELLHSVHDMLHMGSPIFVDPDKLKHLPELPILILGENDEVADHKLHQPLVDEGLILLCVLEQVSHFDYFVKAWPKTKRILGYLLPELID